HWRPLLIEASIFIGWQNAANLYSAYWYRWETTHGNWWKRYTGSIKGYRLTRWADDNPMLDDYVGHPMMGSITNYLYIQNDPLGKRLEFSNTRPYWQSRIRAMGFSTLYSAEWKLGPIGEAAVGHMGSEYFWGGGKFTNET